VVLHGYRQLAPQFIRRFRDLSRPWRLIVAPEALNRFYVGDPSGRHGEESRVGGTWMTREDREVEISDYVRYLDLLLRHVEGGLPAPVSVVGLGFSQGCHTVARWAAYGTSALRGMVLWGEVLPPDLDLDRARDRYASMRIVSVQGRQDVHVTPALLERQSGQVERMGVTLEERWHPLGHLLEPETLRSVAAELSMA
jgi:predicted esterase